MVPLPFTMLPEKTTGLVLSPFVEPVWGAGSGRRLPADRTASTFPDSIHQMPDPVLGPGNRSKADQDAYQRESELILVYVTLTLGTNSQNNRRNNQDSRLGGTGASKQGFFLFFVHTFINERKLLES